MPALSFCNENGGVYVRTLTRSAAGFDLALPVVEEMGFDLVDAEYKKEGSKYTSFACLLTNRAAFQLTTVRGSVKRLIRFLTNNFTLTRTFSRYPHQDWHARWRLLQISEDTGKKRLMSLSTRRSTEQNTSPELFGRFLTRPLLSDSGRICWRSPMNRLPQRKGRSNLWSDGTKGFGWLRIPWELSII